MSPGYWDASSGELKCSAYAMADKASPIHKTNGFIVEFKSPFQKTKTVDRFHG